MKPLPIDHVTAVVPDADAAARRLGALLGRPPVSVLDDARMTVRTLPGGCELHVVTLGPRAVPVRPSVPAASWHHIGLAVDSMAEAMAHAAALGMRALGEPVVTGPGVREVFLDPGSTAGVLIQLVERALPGRAPAGGFRLETSGVSRLVAQTTDTKGKDHRDRHTR
ncbi:VOC family protein [Streptomyces albireticuli]|uniref:VOC family protein n=1 Tax=Streptomyces albireticuli TaxID=1940 RepID=UPI0014760489|nr:VOC family protein [Streptomyces albireticuli]MCD9145729.1 VOC family protein [Streptomyces albireticuli]MCD9165539.1 VOC family protein [Streptomyces albireticuli]MCD9195938.1 VOC family protein [Streptomyces albireticuli]